MATTHFFTTEFGFSFGRYHDKRVGGGGEFMSESTDKRTFSVNTNDFQQEKLRFVTYTMI